MRQLSLTDFGYWYDTIIQSQASVINASSRQLELLQTRLAAISDSRSDNATWHIVSDTLTSPELEAVITTNLTTALHAWLCKNKNAHMLIPAELSPTLRLPQPEAYQASLQTFHLHQRIPLPTLIRTLIAHGYTRSHQAASVNSFYVRGEAVDLAHSTLPGTVTLSFHGDELEQIISHQGRRRLALQQVVIPPAKFPSATVSFEEFIKQFPAAKLDLPPFLIPSTTSSQATPISRQQALELIGSLAVGKPAVHLDHGIGIYEGLTQKITDGAENEYLVLQYDAGDVLFVPVEFAHKVTPYVGEGAPAVHRLGGTVWLKTKRKAKEEAAAFAKELLKTAGERSRAHRQAYTINPELEQELAQTFPYTLTPDQTRTWQEVKGDLASPHPVDRLIVGDVGFGKTEIAVRAARHAVANGRQVALIAPTTLLVQQHADTLRARLPQLAQQIGVLSRFTSAAATRQLKNNVSSGDTTIAVGTHALLSSTITWKNLGLVIIDEEQKFGVRHKEHFKKLRAAVDMLSLSATPIPRTLAMALSGLRELSLIQTAPAGRQAVVTAISPYNEQTVDKAIAAELARHGQIYVVAAKIAHLPAIQRYLADRFPDARIGLAHGRLPGNALANVMHEFDTGAIDILVSSNIVENGLDLPNANTLIVWNATYFGLADLYQLRGRIGRRDRQGFAYFFYHQQELSPVQRERLSSLTEASRLGEGWTIARRDLEIRGAGSLLGAKQSGSANEVGVQLYLDLINQAVQDSRGQASIAQAEINLPLSALLPASYIPSTNERAQTYQRLARAATVADLDIEASQLQSRFGPLPPLAQNLITQMKLQRAAALVGITKIDTKKISPQGDQEFFRVTLHGPSLTTLETAALTPQFARDLLAQLQSNHA